MTLKTRILSAFLLFLTFKMYKNKVSLKKDAFSTSSFYSLLHGVAYYDRICVKDVEEVCEDFSQRLFVIERSAVSGLRRT